MSTEAPSPRRRWLLIGSLALNLFLIGFLVVGALRHNWHREENSRQFRNMLYFMQGIGHEDRFLWRLSDEDRAVMQALKIEHGPVLSASWQAKRDAVEEMRALMRSGERDPATLRAALTKLHQIKAEGNAAVEALILDLAGALSDEAYQDLAGHSHHWNKRD